MVLSADRAEKTSDWEGRRKKQKNNNNTCLVPEVCNFHKIGCVSSRKELPTHELVYAQNAFNGLGKTQSMQFVISAPRCPFHNWLRCLSISRLTRPCALLTPSLPWCHLKTTNESAKSETLKPFCRRFPHWHVKGFSSKNIALKVDVFMESETRMTASVLKCLCLNK